MKSYKLLMMFAMLATAIWTHAQMSETPAITMHSGYYEQYGADATFNIMLGSTAPGTIEVDCGYGRVTYDIAPATYSGGYIYGTIITCATSPEGIVRIYTPENIHLDYLNFSGCELTWLDIAHKEYIDVLDIEHNSITALDLTEAVNASALYLGDNAFARSTPLVVGGNKPRLAILDLSVNDYVDPSFSLTDYPSLVTFDAMSSPWLTVCDPTHCPGLMKLSIDASNVSTLDLSQNPLLTILNISDTAIREIDLSHNPALTQLYCNHSSATYNTDVKLSSLDVSNNPELIYLFCSYNNLTDIDLRNNTKLQDLYIRYNYLTDIDLSYNPRLVNVMISRNLFNYNTLPVDPGTWNEYEYNQRPIPIAKSHLVGAPIDLTAQVYRPDSPTTATLYSISDTDENGTEVDPSLYTFTDGVLTVNTAIADSVYCAFFNPMFPYANLRTRPFMVKDQANYGKPYVAATINAPMLSSTSLVKMYVGIDEATSAKPKTFHIDFGDGQLKAFKATTSKTPGVANVVIPKGCYGPMKIYVDETDNLTALQYDNEYLSDIDVGNSRQLAELTLRNTHLSDIDLSRNNRLERLVLNGNQFGASFSLEGINGAYYKNILRYIDLSNNGLTDIKLSPVDAIHYLNLSHNQLSTINLTDGDFIKSLNLSYNNFETLKLNYLASCTDVDISHNNINELTLPETNRIERFNIAHNRFTFANMPERNGLDEQHFIYAPQQQIAIPAMAPKCNLSNQYINIDGNTTTYTWLTTDGETLADGTDYTIADGITTFLTPAIGKHVYCTISNNAYPALSGNLALRTSEMEVTGVPEYVVGEFTTTSANTISLSIASHNVEDALYIDWGNGDMVQYPMTDTYTAYQVNTLADKRVKIYSFTAESDLSVFSISGQPMKDVDLSKLTHLKCLSLSNAGINSLSMPQSQQLTELTLAGNNFESFDLSAYPMLEYVNFDSNKFTSVDLSGLTNLGNVSFSRNAITDITFGDNPQLWSLFLTGNKLTEIDLSPLTALHQVTLNDNQLTSINVDGLNSLRVLYLDHNRLTFETLPTPQPQWTSYLYYNQQPIDVAEVDGVVDLSSQTSVNGVATIYTWYEGYPSWDTDMGQYTGNILVEGTDYVISEGVTTFLRPINGVICLMTNAVFPNAFMYTNLISVTGGVDSIIADNGYNIAKIIGDKAGISGAALSEFEIYTPSGTLVYRGRTDSTGHATVTLPTKGVYVVRTIPVSK